MKLFFLYTHLIRTVWNIKMVCFNAAVVFSSSDNNLFRNLDWSGTKVVIRSASEDHLPLVCQLSLVRCLLVLNHLALFTLDVKTWNKENGYCILVFFTFFHVVTLYFLILNIIFWPEWIQRVARMFCSCPVISLLFWFYMSEIVERHTCYWRIPKWVRWCCAA